MPTPTSPTTSSTTPSSPDHPLRRPRVSAEHTLARVRENQRRHRARQKSHVVTLSQRVEELEAQLAAARAEMESLRAERDVANAFACYDLSRHFERVDSAVPLIEGVVGAGWEEMPASLEMVGASAAASASAAAPVLKLPGPPPCCSDTDETDAASSPLVAALALPAPSTPECTSCATRPPPSPSESTTLCAQAFVLIAQRNARNLDPALIRLWLSRGYRRAERAGEGCRVEDKTLQGLLEYISGV